MLDRLRTRFSLQNESLHLLSGGVDPAYSGRVWLIPGKTSLNFHVSLLGPYYGIRLPGIPEEEPVAREIEATYPGYLTIPPEIGNDVVHDVAIIGEPRIEIRGSTAQSPPLGDSRRRRMET